MLGSLHSVCNTLQLFPFIFLEFYLLQNISVNEELRQNACGKKLNCPQAAQAGEVFSRNDLY